MKKKAYQEEMERRRKAEEARKETESILAAQVRADVCFTIFGCIQEPAGLIAQIRSLSFP